MLILRKIHESWRLHETKNMPLNFEDDCLRELREAFVGRRDEIMCTEEEMKLKFQPAESD